VTPDALKMLELIEATERQLLLWPSDERTDAEQRLGLKAGDMAVVADPEYSTILRLLGDALRALDAVQQVIEATPQGRKP
jgi:hypothetical protein